MDAVKQEPVVSIDHNGVVKTTTVVPNWGMAIIYEPLQPQHRRWIVGEGWSEGDG